MVDGLSIAEGNRWSIKIIHRDIEKLLPNESWTLQKSFWYNGFNKVDVNKVKIFFELWTENISNVCCGKHCGDWEFCL